jgi:hypothetical protein
MQSVCTLPVVWQTQDEALWAVRRARCSASKQRVLVWMRLHAHSRAQHSTPYHAIEHCRGRPQTASQTSVPTPGSKTFKARQQQPGPHMPAFCRAQLRCTACSMPAHLNDGRQDALCIVQPQVAVDVRQTVRARPRQHTQPYVDLQIADSKTPGTQKA